MVQKPYDAYATMRQIIDNAARFDIRAYLKQLETDGLSRNWLLSDSAENASQILDLILGDALPVSGIPDGMIDALLEHKICTRA